MNEKAPNKMANENVFDIQQGVSILFFIRKTKPSFELAKLYWSEIWGTRQQKYETLVTNSISSIDWVEVAPISPNYFFEPKNETGNEEYKKYWSIDSIFKTFTNGFVTHRDHFVIDFDYQSLRNRISEFRAQKISDAQFAAQYQLSDTSSWHLTSARARIRDDSRWEEKFVKFLYRPFDVQNIFYSEYLLDRHRYDVMKHMLKPNIALVTTRLYDSNEFSSVLVSKNIVEKKAGEATRGTYCFPLHTYMEKSGSLRQSTFLQGDSEKNYNIDNKFVNFFGEYLGLKFVSEGKVNPDKTFGPEDIFHYIYAVLHSPTYRQRYAEFLKIDFPRVPLTGNVGLFRQLCGLGKELISLHLLENVEGKQADKETGKFVGGQAPTVEKGYPKYADGCVLINPTAHFAGIPENVWEFHIGGYQVCEKWLKDRRGRELSVEDVVHYGKVVSALGETVKLMDQIDEIINQHGGWPVK